MTDPITIQTTVKKAGTGDTEAFRELYELLINRVYPYVAMRTRTKEQALDATQDVFIALHKALPSFEWQSEAAFYGFVFTVAKRILAQVYERQSKELGRLDIDLDHTPNQDLAHENVASVKQALDQLDDRAREIVVLHHWSRYSFAEIAVLVDMTESAVRVRHHRAKAKLAILLT